MSAPLGAVVALCLGVTSGLISAVAFVIGGLWLSPDLDTRSNALRRWGMLRVLWWPYRRVIPHRSIWSHGPLIGTAGRLLVLAGWLSLLNALLPATTTLNPLNILRSLWGTQPHQLAALLIGLETSVWLHLVLDGDPRPKQWSRRRRR